LYYLCNYCASAATCSTVLATEARGYENTNEIHLGSRSPVPFVVGKIRSLGRELIRVIPLV
jgi:hypothetical protein